MTRSGPDCGPLHEAILGTEYIGYDDSNNTLKSYFFSNEGPGPFGGVALEYVWEVGDDTLTIWGGYEATMTRAT